MKIQTAIAKLMTIIGMQQNLAGEATGTAVENVTPEAAFTLVKGQQVQVLDIRTSAEFAGGHVPGAVNIDFQNADFERHLGALNPGQAYIIHCAAGGRSTRSLPVFRKLGFKKIYHLHGGMKAWQASKLPLEK